MSHEDHKILEDTLLLTDNMKNKIQQGNIELLIDTCKKRKILIDQILQQVFHKKTLSNQEIVLAKEIVNSNNQLIESVKKYKSNTMKKIKKIKKGKIAHNAYRSVN